MRLNKKYAAILMLLLLNACATHEIVRTVDSACLSFSPLSYAIPPRGADGTRVMVNDQGNRYDTEQTVADLQAFNARYGAVCPAK